MFDLGQTGMWKNRKKEVGGTLVLLLAMLETLAKRKKEKPNSSDKC